MDIRPAIHFWLNKPDTFDDGEDLNEARMKEQSYRGEGFQVDGVRRGNTGWMNLTWGDSFNPLDVWLDIDKIIANLSQELNWQLAAYILHCEEHGHWWEDWPEVPEGLSDAIGVILYGILKS
jgi:hypothetical protein